MSTLSHSHPANPALSIRSVSILPPGQHHIRRRVRHRHRRLRVTRAAGEVYRIHFASTTRPIKKLIAYYIYTSR